jgi:hypothetical protein
VVGQCDEAHAFFIGLLSAQCSLWPRVFLLRVSGLFQLLCGEASLWHWHGSFAKPAWGLVQSSGVLGAWRRTGVHTDPDLDAEGQSPGLGGLYLCACAERSRVWIPFVRRKIDDGKRLEPRYRVDARQFMQGCDIWRIIINCSLQRIGGQKT